MGMASRKYRNKTERRGRVLSPCRSKDGAIKIGGRMPINTHGGQLSEARIHGMNGIYPRHERHAQTVYLLGPDLGFGHGV